jgi:murein DD-endopeptidase MepM/ murein hydrolase activator NlpD
MERFRFNPETLSYQKIELSQRQKFLRFLAFMGLTLSLAAAFLFFRDLYMPSPRTENLEVTQEKLTYELSLMNRDLAQHESRLTQVAFNDDKIYRVYFGVHPYSASIRSVGVGGSRKYDWLQQFKHADLLRKTYLNMDQIERKLVIQSTSFDEVIDLAWTKEEWMAARPGIQPIGMKDLVRFGSSFGTRMHPILKVVRPHEGIDLTAARGTNIYATADGEVLQAGYRAGGFGKKVLLDHGHGYRTLYGHCNEVLVEPGQQVKRGEVIARVGSTGLSKSPHLHYEVHVNGKPVDPINYYANDLSVNEFEHMIDMLSNADPSFDIN